MKKLLLLSFLMLSVSLTAAVQNRYTDPAQVVPRSELGNLDPAELKTLILQEHALINQFRKENGKAPLTIHPNINLLSQMHSEWMASYRYGISHEGSNERYALLVDQLPKVRAGGENVAFCFSMIQDPIATSVEGWKQSSGHRANLLADFNLCGYGIAKSVNNSWYLTHFFITTADQAFVAQTQNNYPEWNGGTASTPEQPQEFTPDAYRKQVLAQFNQIRTEVQRGPLIEHPLPNYYSQMHSNAMAAQQYPVGNTNYPTRFEAMKKYLPEVRNMIEWYAKIPITHPNPAKAAVDEWASDGRKLGAIYNQYNIFGCGISKGNDGYYYFSVMMLFSTDPSFIPKQLQKSVLG